MIYSIAKTAKANQLDVYQYLELLLTEIPKHMDDNNIRLLMICFSGHLQYKKSAQSSIKVLTFQSKKIYIKQPLALQKCRFLLLSGTHE